MKVYVLHYAYYEESEVRGVYTEDTMKKELAQFGELGKTRNDQAIAEHERIIAELTQQRKSLGQEDRQISAKQAELKSIGHAKTEEQKQLEKSLKQNRKGVMRQMDLLARSIRNHEYGLKEMRNWTDKQLAEREMERNHLYFEEFDVL
jgi:hypothetical protein